MTKDKKTNQWPLFIGLIVFSIFGVLASKQITPTALKVYWLLDGKDNNGWLMNTTYGRSDNGILRNASNANMAMGAHLAEHAIYTLGLKDNEGNKLNGKSVYKISMTKPPLKEAGFWSITSYDGNFPLPLVKNRLNKYAINSGNAKELSSYSKQTFHFYYSAEKPDGVDESDWLPAHPNKPLPIFRAYNPEPEIVNGSWPMPIIEKVK